MLENRRSLKGLEGERIEQQEGLGTLSALCFVCHVGYQFRLSSIITPCWLIFFNFPNIS